MVSLKEAARATSWSDAMVARKTDGYAEPVAVMCGSVHTPAEHIQV